MKLKTRVLSLLLAVTLTAGLSAPALAALPDEYYLKTTATIEGGLHSGSKTELSKGFVIASRVFQGDQNGALNWDDTLTRAEAVTMLIRLMGLDGEAPAAAARPCPFSDVPDWARGYVTLAAEKGVTMGMGAFIHSVKASLRPVWAGSTCFISVSSSQVCVLEQRSCIISHKNTKCNKNIPVRLGRG